MSSDSTAKAPQPRAAKGPRPSFFEHETQDMLLSMNAALLVELIATRERLDTLERLMVRKGLLQETEIEQFAATAADEQAREGLRQSITRHTYYLLLQQAERAARASTVEASAPDAT